MSVTNVGASPYPAAQPPLPGQPAAKPGASNSDSNTAGNAASGVSASATGSDASGAARNAADRDADAHQLPPVQAATTPGTGQKVNIIA